MRRANSPRLMPDWRNASRSGPTGARLLLIQSCRRSVMLVRLKVGPCGMGRMVGITLIAAPNPARRHQRMRQGGLPPQGETLYGGHGDASAATFDTAAAVKSSTRYCTRADGRPS